MINFGKFFIQLLILLMKIKLLLSNLFIDFFNLQSKFLFKSTEICEFNFFFHFISDYMFELSDLVF